MHYNAHAVCIAHFLILNLTFVSRWKTRISENEISDECRISLYFVHEEADAVSPLNVPSPRWECKMSKECLTLKTMCFSSLMLICFLNTVIVCESFRYWVYYNTSNIPKKVIQSKTELKSVPTRFGQSCLSSGELIYTSWKEQKQGCINCFPEVWNM